MHDEKPPYFFFWLLGAFFVFCFLVIAYGFAQKQSMNSLESPNVVETVAIETEQQQRL